MKFWEKYTERVEIPESDMSEVQKIVAEGFMREGEHRYREYLLSVIDRVDALMREGGDKDPKLTIKSFRSFVEEEPIELND